MHDKQIEWIVKMFNRNKIKLNFITVIVVHLNWIQYEMFRVLVIIDR